MTVGFMAGFFLVIRGAVLWYCRINEHIENQKNIIKLLEQLNARFEKSEKPEIVEDKSMEKSESTNDESIDMEEKQT